MSYYGLYIPSKSASVSANGNGNSSTTTESPTNNASSLGKSAVISGSGENSGDSLHVYRVKSEALEVLKLHKDARLREFICEDDAVKYAQTGYEAAPQAKHIVDVYTSTASVEKAAFRAPTKQELIEFRKVIESGDCDRVRSIIWDNPRYLVSSGDTPTTLKEGYRYNAMHVCALSHKARIAELILQTVADTRFVDLLTGKKNDQKMCEELCSNLLDYYLNIPEKGRNETPLHLAVKIGNIDMVKVLTSYPECKMTPNREGLLPKDIICSRMPNPSPELNDKIRILLEERFYVPVLRSVDNVVPPQVGQPFSAGQPPNLNCDPLSPEVKVQALAGPMNKEQATQFCRRWKTPPRLGSSTSSPIASNLFISPRKSRNPGSGMSPVKGSLDTSKSGSPINTATPIRRRVLFTSSPLRSPMDVKASTLKDLNDSCINDQRNGNHKATEGNAMAVDAALDETDNIENQPANETNNNHHSQSLPMPPHKLQIKSHTSMLKTALTPLIQLKRDAFFAYRDQYAPSPVACDSLGGTSPSIASDKEFAESPGFKERHIKIMDTEKGLEVIGRELAKEQNVEWREFWDFLNVFVDLSSNDGLQMLENYFAQRVKDQEMAKKAKSLSPSASATARVKGKLGSIMMEDVCSALEKFGFSREPSSPSPRNGFNNDRQFFAESSTNAAQSTQATNPYTCVEKSLQVFAKRMTKTITHNLDNVVSINDTLLSELKRLKSLICSFKEDSRFRSVDFSKVHSRIGSLIATYLDSSQDVTDDIRLKIRNIIKNLLIQPGERREHFECVGSRVLLVLGYPPDQLPEKLKTEEMCISAWQCEKECDCQWETNLSRKSSRRNRIEARYRNHQQAREQEKSKKGNGGDEWRNAEDVDDEEDDVFWSDFGGSDSDDEDEVWATPPESPSRLSLMEDDDDNSAKVFIYGNEPTKRDLDVLNVIFHIDIDQSKYPNISNWKSSLMRYTTEEMDYFPSPAVIKKTQQFTRPSSLKHNPSQVLSPPPLIKKQLFRSKSSLATSPSRPFSTVNVTVSGASATASASSPQLQSPQTIAKQQQTSSLAGLRLFKAGGQGKLSAVASSQSQHERPVTPLNKLRGLFSAYREHVESSPMADSTVTSATPAAGAFRSSDSSDASNNLSLLNVSMSE